MVYSRLNFRKNRTLLMFFLITFITIETLLHYSKCNNENLKTNTKGRYLSEKVIYNSVDLNANKNVNRNMFDDEYCEVIHVGGIFSRIKNNFKNLFSRDLENCLQAQYYKRLIDNFKNILENITITKTKVCLIDTGINKSDEILKEHFSNQEDYGINTEDCTKHNYPSCGTSNIEDVSNHGSFIADTIVNNNMLRKSGSYNQQATLFICKASGDPKQSNLFSLMKCLDYCQLKETKIIHMNFNVVGRNEMLRKMIENLKEKGTILVVPGKNECVLKSRRVIKNDDDIILASASMENIFKTDIFGDKNIRVCSLIYPAAYSYIHKNVFSVGSINYFPSYVDKIDHSLGPYNSKSSQWNMSFFNFTYKFNKHHKYNAELFATAEYASASFTNTLLLMHNIYPDITVEQIRSILNKSIISHSNINKYTKLGGYVNIIQMLQELFHEKRMHSKIIQA